MAARSLAREVQLFRRGDGARFRGEGILAFTKAPLKDGVGHFAGNQGAPMSQLPREAAPKDKQGRAFQDPLLTVNTLMDERVEA